MDHFSSTHSMALPSHHTTQAVDAMHHAQYLPQYHQPASQSYQIPLPNGMDSDFDFRSAFYSYIPHEVKHRKRTTRAQLKLLESTYAKDPKPVASVRKSLALQLEMTARAVQVWFQNRRAKDKQLAKKAKAAADQQQTLVAPLDDSIVTDNDIDDETPVDSPLDVSPSGQEESSTTNSAFAFARRAGGPAPLGLGISQTSWGGPSNAQPRPTTQVTPPPSDEYLSLRRGSLPIIATRATTPGSLRPIEPSLGRRRSLEPTQSRLSGHPYAAAVQPTQILPPSLPFISQARSSSAQPRPSAEDANGAYRPALMHRGSVPGPVGAEHLQPHQRSTSSPAVNLPQPAQRLISSPPYRHLPPFAFPPRVITAPLPGPLPAADFSFGAPADHTHQPAQHHQTPPHQAEERVEEDATYQNGAYSRYGSIASLAESDLSGASEFSRFGSIASATGSELTNASGHAYGVESYGGLQLQGMEKGAYDPELRRPSAAGEQFVDMFSTLGVENNSPHGSNGGLSLNYPSPEAYSNWAPDQAIGQLEYSIQQQSDGERTTPTGPAATIAKSQLTVSTGMYGLSGFSPSAGMSSLPSATSSVSSLGLPLDCSPQGSLAQAYYTQNGAPHDFTTPTNAPAAGDMDMHVPAPSYADMHQQHHYVPQNVADQAYLSSYAPHHIPQMISEPVSSLTAALAAPGEESYYS